MDLPLMNVGENVHEKLEIHTIQFRHSEQEPVRVRDSQ